MPVAENCPDCGKILYHKKGKPMLVCHDEKCGFTKPYNPPKEEDPDQKPDDTEQKPDDTEQKPNDTQKPVDEGCASVMTLGAASMMLIAAAWVTLATRKKED
jgi:DNA-directed RNA polymerase subunit M/transcription elongation factor TFIIS